MKFQPQMQTTKAMDAIEARRPSDLNKSKCSKVKVIDTFGRGGLFPLMLQSGMQRSGECGRMALGDPKYFLFLAASVAVFYMIRGERPRAVWLLIVSYVFYFNLSRLYVVILVAVTAAAFAGGLIVERCKKTRHRNLLFGLLCAVILAPLIVFKYLGFLLGVAAGVISFPILTSSPLQTLALPVGISFFTFVALGYLIDVYLEVIDPEHRPVNFALFLAFFPLVTAGPIERGGGLLPQFNFDKSFSSDRALSACRLIFLGLFLKIVCADNLFKPADEFFANPSAFIPLEKLFALMHYSFYIYTDFAGYSLIAVGSAALFGLDVRPNFRQPFLSTSIPEFWRNWHMSLSSWVRDYLFTPLRMQARRYPNAGMIAALMISFTVLGAWHGAGWGFVLFGVTHGALSVASVYTLRLRDDIWLSIGAPATLVHAWRIVCTFLLVALAFVFFRANSVADAGVIYRSLLSLDLLKDIAHAIKVKTLQPNESVGFQILGFYSWTWLIIAVVIVGDVLARNRLTLERLPRLVQFAAYNAGLLMIMYGWMSAGASQPFLYYRF